MRYLKELNLDLRMKLKTLAKYPKLTRGQNWVFFKPRNSKKQMQYHRLMKELKHPIIDHESYWALRQGPGRKGPAKWDERVLVSYTYTVGLPKLEERLEPLRNILAEVGYTMSQRVVMYGDNDAHELIIATHENIEIASELVLKMNQKGRMGKRKVRYDVT